MQMIEGDPVNVVGLDADAAHVGEHVAERTREGALEHRRGRLAEPGEIWRPSRKLHVSGLEQQRLLTAVHIVPANDHETVRQRQVRRRRYGGAKKTEPRWIRERHQVERTDPVGHAGRPEPVAKPRRGLPDELELTTRLALPAHSREVRDRGDLRVRWLSVCCHRRMPGSLRGVQSLGRYTRTT